MPSSSPARPTLNGDGDGVAPRSPADHDEPPLLRYSVSSASSSRPPPVEPSTAAARTDIDAAHVDAAAAAAAAAQSPRRTAARHAGGFLLGSVGHAAGAPAAADIKGKRKRHDSVLVVPKTRARPPPLRRPPSGIGSSPLSQQVLPRPRGGADDEPAPPPSSSTAAAAVGRDPDPAQIVQMALTLSNARRRKASERRYVSADQVNARTLSVATTATPNSANARQSSSIAQYVTLSPDSSNNNNNDNHTDNIASSPVPADQSQPAPQFFLHDDGQSLQISPATRHRVQKAKAYFELAYEHRRLLSHLPPVARPGSNTSYQSKQYNPLQYIRNRKLRVWDKTAYDPEEDGWHDVDRVRDWVNSVIESHPETRHDADECVRLPPLSSKPASGTESDSDANRLKPPKARRRRPRSDWVTHPGDLIADCFWLEQGVNKVKILDHDNHHIYPPNTHFRFSGWRNNTPLQVPDSFQSREQPPPPPPPQRQESPSPNRATHRVLADALALPTFRSARHRRQGHRSRAPTDPAGQRHNKVQQRKGLKMFMEDSDAGSDSSRSPGASEDEADRGRKRRAKQWQKNMHSDESSAAVSLMHPKKMLFPGHEHSHTSSSAQNSSRPSLDHGLLARLKRDPANRSRNRNDAAAASRPDSLIKAWGPQDLTRSSAEYDSTAPDSPRAAAAKPPVWPSIVINLDSPPPSRAPSPVKKAKTFSRLQDRSNPSKAAADSVAASDVALAPNAPDLNHHHGRRDGDEDSSGTAPGTRGPSPFSPSRTKSTNNVGVTFPDHAAKLLQEENTKPASPPSGTDHPRMRAIFKGGRIAELVGTEVSKVSHFIRKREPLSHGKQDSTSTSSLRSQHAYDSYDEADVDGFVLKTPPQAGGLHSNASTRSTPPSDRSTAAMLSRPTTSTSAAADRPVYHNPNLPTFTSPFQRDKEKQDVRQAGLAAAAAAAAAAPANPDHISVQVAERRSASRPARLDRLALPRLDTSRSASPARPDAVSRTSGRGGGPGDLLDLTNSQAASDSLNRMMSSKSAESLGGARLAPTQSRLDLSRGSSRDGGAAADAEPDFVTTADVARARALILASAIKAREIERRAAIYHSAGPKLRLDASGRVRGSSRQIDLSLIRRREENVVAARQLVLTLAEQGATLDGKMKQFSTCTVPHLHRLIQDLEDLVDNKLTPRVRVSADRAGDLSTKLNMSSTLAAKNLNDTINQAFRKRSRGPLRSIRRLFYVAIEYVVVAILWAIWAVVTSLSIFLRIGKCSIQLGRWLLFLD